MGVTAAWLKWVGSPAGSPPHTESFIRAETLIVQGSLQTFFQRLAYHHPKQLWCWEALGAGGEGDDRGWDGWMASPTRWTWIWVNSGSWWWTGRPGVLRFTGSQRVRLTKSRTRLSDWTELNWTLNSKCSINPVILCHSILFFFFKDWMLCYFIFFNFILFLNFT